MILVVDANSIIAALIKDSKAREIITSGKFTLISPDYIRDELDKHKNYIAKKAKISVTELDLLIILLSKRIRTIQLSDYKAKIEEAKEIMGNDLTDVPYVACYLALNCDGIWTNDLDYDNKVQLKTFKTSYLSKLLGN